MSEIKALGECDVCGDVCGKYANIKINGLVICDGCCYDPNKAETVKSMARLKKCLVEEVERLRSERDEFIHLLEQFVKFDSNEVTYTSLRISIAEAINLLAKIKGEDNE